MKLLLAIMFVFCLCGISYADGGGNANGRPTTSGGTTKQDQQKKYTYEHFSTNSSF